MSAVPTQAAQPPLNLRAIYLDYTETKLGEDFDPLLPGQQLTGWNTATPHGAKLTELRMESSGEIMQSLEFKTRFEFTYRVASQELTDLPSSQRVAPPPEFSDQKFAASVTTVIVASFFLSADSPPPPEDMVQAWASTTVLSVSWPYWREFCHTAFHRMHLPQTLLPLIFIRPVQSAAALAGAIPAAPANQDPQTKGTPRSKTRAKSK